jgi:hypothetical protein
MAAGLGGAGAVVLALVVILLLASTNGSRASTPLSAGGTTQPTVPGQPSPTAPASPQAIPTTPAPAWLVSALDDVTPAELAAAGVTTSSVQFGGQLVNVKTPRITLGGKPGIVYVGAEFCPYCAVFRWPMAIALMRFGSLTGLDQSASSLYDVYSGTRTLSFVHARYSSPYLGFSSTEFLSNVCASLQDGACTGYEPLQDLSGIARVLYANDDTETYFPALSGSGSTPFVDFDGRYLEAGALSSPELLANLSWRQIADSLADPTAGSGQAILETANFYTALFCVVDGGKPGSVCSTPVVQQAELLLPR